MYLWNDVKLSIKGDNKEFINGIKKYFNAVYDHEFDGDCDIEVSVFTSSSDLIPSIPKEANHVKSQVFDMNGEMRLDIYSSKPCIWYIYRNMAKMWIDFNSNKMYISINQLPLDFEYYNILLFFLHPLGALLENFGFFRLHSSCSAINGKSLLVTGISGSGKSTSAFSVPLFGGQIIADDLTFVKKTGENYHTSSLTRLVKLRNNSIARFYPELSRLSTAAHYEDETYFYLDDVNSSTSENITLIGIAILNKTGESSSAYRSVHPSKIVPELFPSSIHTNIPENAGRKFIFIADMLNDLNCYEIDFGTDMFAYYGQLKQLSKESDCEE